MYTFDKVKDTDKDSWRTAFLYEAFNYIRNEQCQAKLVADLLGIMGCEKIVKEKGEQIYKFACEDNTKIANLLWSTLVCKFKDLPTLEQLNAKDKKTTLA